MMCCWDTSSLTACWPSTCTHTRAAADSDRGPPSWGTNPSPHHQLGSSPQSAVPVCLRRIWPSVASCFTEEVLRDLSRGREEETTSWVYHWGWRQKLVQLSGARQWRLPVATSGKRPHTPVQTRPCNSNLSFAHPLSLETNSEIPGVWLVYRQIITS